MRISRSLAGVVAWGLLGGAIAGAVTVAATIGGLSDRAAVVPVAIMVAVVVSSALAVRRAVRVAALRREKADRVASRELQKAMSTLETRLREVQAAAAFSAMDVPYPLPLGGWALKHDAAAILAREVALARPATVVELGSGASSIVIGMQLRRAGRGHLYTLDHEPDFADITRGHVAANGLEAWVTVLDAPLAALPLHDETYTWYQVPEVVARLEAVDLLVVDGPPQATDRDGIPRYPALPVFAPLLAPDALVIVDDARRDGERRMLERWAREHPDFGQRVLPTLVGLALLRRRPPV